MRTELYPLLRKADGSIEETQMILQTMSAGLRQAFQKQMNTQIVATLKVDKMLDPKNANFNVCQGILKTFETDNVQDALIMIEGTANIIQNILNKENSKRKLTDLKADFL